MKRLRTHITQCLIAGIVAMLPIGGLIITVGYMESVVSSSGLSHLPFYFPGFGLLVTAVFIYLVGLGVTSFFGKLIWTRVDRLLEKLPALGRLYQTLKQILGYGEGKDAIFHETVLIPGRDPGSEELGLVTNKISDETGKAKLIIFVPGVPNPTSGRLVIMDEESVKPLAMPVTATLKTLVSMGKTDIDLKSLK